MAQDIQTLNATKREVGRKSANRALRESGMLPGVVYGNEIDTQPVAVDPREVHELAEGDFGTNVVFQLDVEGGGNHLCMLKDWQFDPVRRDLTHVDFCVVTPDQRVVIQVPIETEGRAKGVRAGGRLMLARRTVKLSCAVDDIPARVVHDVTPLKIGDTVYVDELTAPEGCTFEYKGRFPVIRVFKRRGVIAEDEEAEEGVPAAPAAEAPEGEAAPPV